MCLCFFFFNDTATTEIYTLSLHDALPIYVSRIGQEFLEIFLTIIEVIGCKAPHVHAHRSLIDNVHPFALLILVSHGALYAGYLRALYHGRQVAFGVSREIGRASCRERV